MSPDTERDAGDVPTSMLHGAPDTLKSELRDRLRCLECQVEAERQAHSEARRLLAAALERIPAIEVPQETQESPETVAMSSKVREVSPATGEAQEDVQRPRSAASGVGY